jgi:hypothetical protein
MQGLENSDWKETSEEMEFLGKIKPILGSPGY